MTKKKLLPLKEILAQMKTRGDTALYIIGKCFEPKPRKEGK